MKGKMFLEKKSHRILPEEVFANSFERMTVSAYLLLQLSHHGSSFIHTFQKDGLHPFLNETMKSRYFDILTSNSMKEAIWASEQTAHHQGISAIYATEESLADLLEGVTRASKNLHPLVFIVQRSMKLEMKELCGFPISIDEESQKDLYKQINRFSASAFLLDDRTSAPKYIDRSLDASRELMRPVVLYLPDEIATAKIPPHTYKKTVFNFEDKELIDQSWNLILSRLSQAKKPLFVLGGECRNSFFSEKLIRLGQGYNATIVGSEEIYGHVKEGIDQFFSLEDFSFHPSKEGYDAIFLFGSSSDTLWVESMLTHHALSPYDETLFFIDTYSLFFGEDEPVLVPSFKEFFAHTPCSKSENPKNEKKESATFQDNPLLQTLRPLSCPIFTSKDSPHLPLLLKMNPFGRLFIQPPNSSHEWYRAAIKGEKKASSHEGPFIILEESKEHSLELDEKVLFLSTKQEKNTLKNNEELLSWLKSSKKQASICLPDLLADYQAQC